MVGGVRRTLTIGAVGASVLALVVLRAGPEARRPVESAPANQPAPAPIDSPLVGAWASRAGAGGYDLRADGTWSNLLRQSGGAYLRATGWGEEGWWEIWPSPDMANGITLNRDATDSLPLNVEWSAGGILRLGYPVTAAVEYERLPAGAVVGEVPSASPRGVYAPTSEQEYATAVARPWLLAGANELFGTDEAGLDLRPGGRWSKLRRQADGSLVRGVGWGEEGSWEVANIGGPDHPRYQIGLRADGEGGRGPVAYLSSRRDVLRLQTPGLTDYRAAPAAATIVAAAPKAGTVIGLARPASEAEFVRMVVGMWRLPYAPSFFGTDEAGLEIRADGGWSKLARSATGGGELVRLDGAGNSGRWEVVDTSAMNGPNAYQLNVIAAGTWSTSPVFSADRQVMRLVRDNDSNQVADYVRPG